MIAALALAVTALVGLHGYGSFPPWVVPGVVRVPAADGSAYLEVRVQASGHVGSRPGDTAPRGVGSPAPDTYRVVALANPGSVRATPRWMRARERRALEAGDRVLGTGALKRAPLAVALIDGDRALAVCDLDGVTVQELDGAVRSSISHAETFGAAPSGRFEGNRVWGLDWAQSPPRSCALFDDGVGQLVVAVRFDSEGWRTARIDVRDGRVLGPGRVAPLPALDDLAPTPAASVGLELHALRLRPGAPPDPTLLRNARRVLADQSFPWEARLVAASIAARTCAPAERHAAQSAFVGVVRELLREGVGGHSSFDDWLALALLPRVLDAQGEVRLPEAEARALAVALAHALVERELPEAGASLRLLGPAAVAPLLSARERLESQPPAEGGSARLLASVDGALEALLLDPSAREGVLTALRSRLERGEGRALLEVLLRGGAAAATSTNDVRPALIEGLADAWPAALDVPGPVTSGVFLALVARLRVLEEEGEAGDARRCNDVLRASVWSPPAARTADEWWSWYAQNALADPLPGDLERAVRGPASPSWGTPAWEFEWLLDEAGSLPEAERWPLLRDTLRAARDRLDELGLRGPLAASLGWTTTEAPPGAPTELPPAAAEAWSEILGWL